MSEQISGLMGNSMKGIKDLIDVNSIIGDPITTPDGTTLIPVSKVTFGFASGGSDIANSGSKDVFGGGGGGGVTIHPICFLVVKDGDVKVIHISESRSTGDRIVNMIPEVVDKVSSLINKKEAAEEDSQPDPSDPLSNGIEE